MQHEITDEIWRTFTAARDAYLRKHWDSPPAADLGPGSEHRLAEIAALDAVAPALRAQGMQRTLEIIREQPCYREAQEAAILAELEKTTHDQLTIGEGIR